VSEQRHIKRWAGSAALPFDVSAGVPVMLALRRWSARSLVIARLRRWFRPELETLEDRTLLASAISYSQGVLALGPTAYYRLGEAPGATTAADSSGNGNNGTYNNNTDITLGVPGAIKNDPNTAAAFDGQNNAFVNLPTAATLGINNAAFSAAAWVNLAVLPSTLGRDEDIFGTDTGSGSQGLHLTTRGNQFYLGFYGNDTGGTQTLSINQWYFVVFTYDPAVNGGQQSIYVNGTLDSQSGGHGAFNGGNQIVHISREFGGSAFQGTIDEAAIFPKALTPAQILNLYYLGANPGMFFTAPTTIPSGGTNNSWQVVTGDFNGDGKTDLAVADYNGGKVSVLLGNGAGGFTVATSFNSGGSPNGIVAADFNGDGKLDLATSNNGTNAVSIFLGNGNGTFTAASGSPITGLFNGPSDLKAADFNSDGKLDLAVTNNGTQNIVLLLGNGNGTFSPASGSPFAAGGGSSNFLSLGDFNGDGKPDLVQGNASNNTVSVLLGNGAGSLSQAVGSPFSDGGSSPQKVAVGDFNNDGIPDLAIANFGAGNLSIMLGHGDGTFTATSQTPIAVGSNPYFVAAADLNGDGNLDLVAGNNGTTTLTLLVGKGDGTFTRFRDIPVTSNPSSVAFGDFNGDGAPDMVVGYYPGGGATVSVLLNEGGTRTTLASSLNPSTFGQSVTFTATVTAAVGGAPQLVSGSVAFFDGTALLGTGAVNASGQATFSTSALTSGSHAITAVYTDSNGFFYKSTSAVLTQTVNKAATTTTLTSSANTALSNQAVTFAATVSGPGPTPPSGTVTFLDSGTPIGTGTLSGGKATFTTTLTAGSHSITAVYNGDSNYLTSTSSPLNEAVNPAVPPPPPPLGIYAVGADAGTVAQVNVYDARTGALKFILLPFGTAFRGGVRVAVGDVNGDGVGDIICAAGPGGLPEVVVYDGVTGNPIRTFFAFGTATSAVTAGSPGVTSNLGNISGFTGGLYVAAGDVMGNGYADVIVGAGPGTSPQVQVWDMQTGNLVANFFAFETPNFRGGVRVAAGDITGSRRAAIILAAGPGGGPQVEALDLRTGTVLANYYAFGAPGFGGGVFIGTGDVNGDGKADIICGSGVGPQVSVYDGNANVLVNFFAYPAQNYLSGVRVAGRDLNGDGKADILVVPGPGLPSETVGYDAATLALLTNFYAFSLVGFNGGAYIG
jgi:hypothetical protein